MSDDRPGDRLDLWKDIASYLNRGVSTVQRWEKREGMPVHRHLHDKLGSVYAYRSELDEWWASRRARLEQEDPAPSAEAEATPEAAAVMPPAEARSRRHTSIAVAFAAGAAMALVFAFIFAAVRAPAEATVGVVRFQVPAPPGTVWDSAPSGPHPAVSPDGRHIAVLAAESDGRHRLWVQSLDTQTPRVLADVEGTAYPFWSPDARFVAYTSGGKLRKVRVGGGVSETICELSAGIHGARDMTLGSGTWNADGQILFTHTGGLAIVPAAGGDPVAVTTLDASRGETSHRFPQFLADGRRYLFLVRSAKPEHQGIYLGELGSSRRDRVVDADSNVVIAGDDTLLFIREATLVAQRFSADQRRLVGEPVPIGSGVVRGPTVRFAPFSASSGVLAYRSGAVGETQLVRVDRAGRTVGLIGAPGPYPAQPALSPDGRQVATALFDLQSGGSDIWLFDVARGARSRLTSHPALEISPMWTRDGRGVVFSSNRGGPWDLYERRLDESGSVESQAERLLVASPTNKYAQTWTADGEGLVFTRLDFQTGEDLWIRDASGKETIYLQTPFAEREAQMSPDGRWMAYVSDESGQPEVYVRPFPASGGVWKVSLEGGVEPRWRDDGRELYYVGPDRRLIAVAIAPGPTFSPGEPTTLFDMQVADTLWWDYSVMPGGREFIVKRPGPVPSSPLTVVVNWRESLRQ